MPWGDGTGPWGLGPMTGRAAGYCAGYPVPGYMNPIPGFGRRIGRGFGRGFWHWGRGRGFWWRGYYPYPVFYRGVAPVYYPRRYLTSDSIYPKNIYPEPTKEEEKAYLQDLLKSLEEELKAVRERLQELSKEKGESQ
ncbi:MAG: hypothetical protein DRN08_01585 [Thermoplasmata archaeon]|nr:MAG: hypothetical protein DRN05_06990 [Thermoplasmata archaeon]RLF36292.1 MAG: hypothetical protein DRN08_01585 [Thermoplasmata archaeon]